MLIYNAEEELLMKVLEIKNNLVKIAYDVKDNLVLSDFVILEDENTPYVAQIVNLKADTAANFAIVKLLFTFNEEGILKSYNGSIPSLKASVSKLPSNELLDILPVERPVKLGTLAQQEFVVRIDQSMFETNLVICSNKQENTNILLDNLIRQFEPAGQKTVIFDTNGEFEWEKKVTFGSDFKLPLNYETINFIYENDLEDVDAASKAIIQDIFLEVQEYTKTLPEGFIPFDSFFSVVDQQYKETGITQLVLLKNKLLKYRDAEVFAQNLKDVLNLSIAVEKTDTVVLDISTLTPKLQNEVISYAYDVMSKIKAPIYSFVKAENGTVTKKLLKKIVYGRNNVSTTVICGHEFKYLNELKHNAENLILFAPLSLQHDFASYNTFLNKLNADEYIVYGSLTQSIPLIVQLEEIEIDEPETEQENEENTNNGPVPMPFPAKQGEEIITVEEVAEPEHETEPIIDDTVETPIIDDSLVNSIQEEPLIIDEEIQEPISEEISEELIIVDEPAEVEAPEVEDITQEEVIAEPLLTETIDEAEEAPVIEEEILTESPVIEQIKEPIIEEQVQVIEEPIAEEPEIEIIDSTHNIEEPLEIQYEEAEEPEIVIETETFVNDDLTEDDLNFIDGLSLENQAEDTVSTDVLLNTANETTFEEEILPEPEFIEEEPVPVVPIYSADENDNADIPVFEPGEAVSHPKYGKGVVEKMIKYGNKTLCSINFQNIGRRLLDPSMSEIQRI